MTLDRAIEIFTINDETNFSDIERLFRDKAENIQFLADAAVSENLRELYLIQLSNLKKAFNYIKTKKSELKTVEYPVDNHSQLFNSADLQLLEKEADEAFLDTRIQYAKNLYTKITEINRKHTKAIERAEFCSVLLSEYKKADDERKRIKILKEEKSTLQKEYLKKQEDELIWINESLNADEQVDGELSGLIKSMFLSGKGLRKLPTSNKNRKKKKEAIIFGSVVLCFAMGVMLYTYNEIVFDYFQINNADLSNNNNKEYSLEEYKAFADELYEDGNYVKALIQYSLASAIAPQDEYLQEQIAVCKLLIQQDRKSIPAAYTNQEEEKIVNDEVNVDIISDEKSVIDSIESISDSMKTITENNNLTNTELANINENVIADSSKQQQKEAIIADDDLIPDKIESTEGLDSLFATDDSAFVASIGDSTVIPNVVSLAKKDVNIALNVDDNEVKKRILEKANERILEDQEFLSKIYMVVEKRPEPKGGFDNFKEYLKRNLEYPEKAVKNKIEGVVYVQFIVNRDGSVSAAKTTTNLGYGLEEEAVRLVSEYPGWVPGQIKSRNVNVQTSLPIWFVQQ